MSAMGPGSTPQQNTEETGKLKTPVKEYHTTVSDTMMDYNYLTSMYTRGLMILDLLTKFKVGPDSLFMEHMPDGFYKLQPGLPPDEYKRLVGEKHWKVLEPKYESEKYLVYDNTQPKDPQTQLYPEFKLMFRKSPYIKISWTRYEDDGCPEMKLEFKSDSEYSAG